MDIGGIIAALCAFSIVCFGSLALLAFVVLRVAGRSLGSIITDTLGGGEQESFRASSIVQPRQRFKPKRDSSRFDEAVQRHSDKDSASSSSQFGAQSAGRKSIPSASPLDYENESGLGGIDPDLKSLRGRSDGSKKRRDSYEIYDDEGDAGDIMDLLG